jgi:steroid 5-alpha reductase family enzyme
MSVQLYAVSGILVVALMTLLWVVSLAMKNTGIVDIFWGFGFVIVTWVTFSLTPSGLEGRRWLLPILVTVWGSRLSLHLFLRNWRKPEDFRYRAWRDESPATWWWRSYVKVFLLQGALMWVIAAPLVAALSRGGSQALTLTDLLAIPVWLIGFFFEAVGDWQLRGFKADPANKGRVMNRGLWRYSRHPNYFGDAAQWWAFYLFALAAGGWWTIFSPLMMTGLLLRVSGVTLLERTLKETKPDYRGYVETTSAFVPWFPRRVG